MKLVIYHQVHELVRYQFVDYWQQSITNQLIIINQYWLVWLKADDQFLRFFISGNVLKCHIHIFQYSGFFRGFRSIHSVHLSFLLGGWTSYQRVGGGVDRTLIFREGLVGKKVTFLRGSCNFYVKNKLKSIIFNDKKSL